MRFLKIIFFNLLLLFLGILALEFFLGHRWGYDRLVGLDIHRNMKSKINLPGDKLPSGTKENIYKRDSFGFRGKYPSPDKIDILTMGGSTTAQIYVGEGRTWQDVMSSDFSKNGKTVHIVNAGVEGQTSYGHAQSFPLWFAKIPRLKPRYILVYVGINDLSLPLDYHADELSDNISAWERFKNKSVFYRAYQKFTLWYQRTPRGMYRHALQPQKKIFWTDQPVLSNPQVLFAPYLENYARRLARLIGEIHKMGSRLIFVTQAIRSYKIVDGKVFGDATAENANGLIMNGVDEYYFLTALNQTLMKVCRQANGICIDLASELTFENSDFYDVMHTNSSGSAKIGHYLYEKLKHVI